MKQLLGIIAILISIAAHAKEYYVDVSYTGDKCTGSISNPFKNLSQVQDIISYLKPGDKILFNRGTNPTGRLVIGASGTASEFITLTAYGIGKNPVFEYDLNDHIKKDDRNIITISGQYISIDGLTFEDSTMSETDHAPMCNVAYAIAIKNNHNKVTNCIIRRMGTGVDIVGDDCVVANCVIENTRMILSTPQSVNPDDDYGANGVVISGRRNTVTNCVIKDCYAPCYDFGNSTTGFWDGGAIEIFGSDCSDNLISNCVCYNNEGFMELGGPQKSRQTNKADDIVVSNNILQQNVRLIWVNSNIQVSNLKVDSCTIIEDSMVREKTEFLVGIGTPIPDRSNIIQLTNNQFIIKTPVSLIRNNVKGSQVLQAANVLLK